MFLVTSSGKAGTLYEFESAVFVRDCYHYRQECWGWGVCGGEEGWIIVIGLELVCWLNWSKEK